VSLPRVPNLSDLQAGDVVLVKADPSPLGATIRGVQGSLLSASPPHGDPDWTHVGLYVGEGLIVETVPGHGVRYCPVSQYAAQRDLRARRLVRRGAQLSVQDGQQIVRAAAEFFEQKYSYRSIVNHLMMQAKVSNPAAFFCSSFVAIAYMKGIKVLLETDVRHRPLFPATLANHPWFDDIDLEWRTAV
jgi:uncharacterized protein YycO